MPTHNQLCTLCSFVAANLLGLQEHLRFLQQETTNTQRNIIAAQGILAALQVATGEKYDTVTVPFDLVIEPE